MSARRELEILNELDDRSFKVNREVTMQWSLEGLMTNKETQRRG